MTTASLSEVRRQPRPQACLASVEDGTDAHLLGRFIEQQDGAAFAELVRRHGSMVLGVSRRILHNPHDAEDCFQAAFMVLVRKATSIQPREMVGNWLYGVAYRTALEARKMAAKRRARERKKPPMQTAEVGSDRWEDLRPILDQEINRLPDDFRAVLVLCDLEGKTRAETARQLGLPEGTVASRLARARALLAKRLNRHVLAMSAAGLAVELATHAAESVVPASLIARTTRAATQLAAGDALPGLVGALTDRVIRGMALSKLRPVVAGLVVVALLSLGIGSLMPSLGAERTPDEIVAPMSGSIERATGCIVQSVDPVGRTIQATTVGADGIVDLQVGSATQIFVDGQIGRLTDLRVGMAVHLEYERREGVRPIARRIDAVGEQFDGLVHAITEQSLTVEYEDASKGLVFKKICELDQDAKITINGKKAKYGDLKKKMLVTLQMSATKPVVVNVNVTGPKIQGTLKFIDLDRHAITLVGKDGVPIAIQKDAAILIDGKRSRLADLKSGLPVVLRMAAESDEDVVVTIIAGNPLKK